MADFADQPVSIRDRRLQVGFSHSKQLKMTHRDNDMLSHNRSDRDRDHEHDRERNRERERERDRDRDRDRVSRRGGPGVSPITTIRPGMPPPEFLRRDSDFGPMPPTIQAAAMQQQHWGRPLASERPGPSHDQVRLFKSRAHYLAVVGMDIFADAAPINIDEREEREAHGERMIGRERDWDRGRDHERGFSRVFSRREDGLQREDEDRPGPRGSADYPPSRSPVLPAANDRFLRERGPAPPFRDDLGGGSDRPRHPRHPRERHDRSPSGLDDPLARDRQLHDRESRPRNGAGDFGHYGPAFRDDYDGHERERDRGVGGNRHSPPLRRRSRRGDEDT